MMSLRSKSVKRSNAKSINFKPRHSSLVFSQLTSNQLSLVIKFFLTFIMENLGTIPVDVEIGQYHNIFTLIFREAVYPSEALPFEPLVRLLTFPMYYGDLLHWV